MSNKSSGDCNSRDLILERRVVKRMCEDLGLNHRVVYELFINYHCLGVKREDLADALRVRKKTIDTYMYAFRILDHRQRDFIINHIIRWWECGKGDYLDKYI